MFIIITLFALSGCIQGCGMQNDTSDALNHPTGGGGDGRLF